MGNTGAYPVEVLFTKTGECKKDEGTGERLKKNLVTINIQPTGVPSKAAMITGRESAFETKMVKAVFNEATAAVTNANETNSKTRNGKSVNGTSRRSDRKNERDGIKSGDDVPNVNSDKDTADKDNDVDGKSWKRVISVSGKIAVGKTMMTIQQMVRERRAQKNQEIVSNKIDVSVLSDKAEAFDVNAYYAHNSQKPWNSGTSVKYGHVSRNIVLRRESSLRSYRSRGSTRGTTSNYSDSGLQSRSGSSTTSSPTSTNKPLTKRISDTSSKTTSSLPPVSECGNTESIPEVAESESKPESSHSSINIKIDSDTTYCWITGSVLLTNNWLLVCDHNNKAVKEVNLTKLQVDNAIQMEHRPWDITKIRTGHIFVTLPYLQEIKCLVNVEGVLYHYPKGSLKVQGTCFGIESHQDTLIVTFEHPAKIEILDTKGDVLRTFTTNNVCAPLVHVPKYVCTNPRGDVIYVTDWKDDTVTCISINGTVLATYKHFDLQDPSGVTTDLHSNVYVCSRHTNSIHMIRSTGKRVKVAFNETDGIHSPLSITCDYKRKKLYVGNVGDCIRILDIPA